MFEYLSSPMRWCESKFVYSEFIAEFWNSLTSLSMCLFAIYGYLKHKNLNLDNKMWFMLGSIGVTSFLFHFTLSFIGKFLDELSIIVLVTYCLSILYELSNVVFFYLVVILGLVSWFIPFASPFILMILGVILTLSTYKRNYDIISNELWLFCIKIGLLSVFFWIFDFVCVFNTHSIWHILIGYTGYLMIIYINKFQNKMLFITDDIFPLLV